MLKRTFKYALNDLNIDTNLIEKVIGYKSSDSPEVIRQMIDESLELTVELSNSLAEYVIYDEVLPDLKKGILQVGEVKLSTGKIILSQIRKAEKAALFLCTAGKEISDMSSRLMKDGDLLRGYIFDVIGSDLRTAYRFSIHHCSVF